MKGVIHGKTIYLEDDPPSTLQDGEEIEIQIIRKDKDRIPFPTFDLSIKEDCLNREKIYEI